MRDFTERRRYFASRKQLCFDSAVIACTIEYPFLGRFQDEYHTV